MASEKASLLAGFEPPIASLNNDETLRQKIYFQNRRIGEISKITEPTGWQVPRIERPR